MLPTPREPVLIEQPDFDRRASVARSESRNRGVEPPVERVDADRQHGGRVAVEKSHAAELARVGELQRAAVVEIESRTAVRHGFLRTRRMSSWPVMRRWTAKREIGARKADDDELADAPNIAICSPRSSRGFRLCRSKTGG